jgi:tetratricopeptide (TPR) repeat protein
MNKYKFRNLNKANIYYNPNVIALLQNYRSAFIQLTANYSSQKDTNKVKEILSKMNDVIPEEVIPYTNFQIRAWTRAYQYYASLLPIEHLTAENYREDELEIVGELLIRLDKSSIAQVAFEEVIKKNPNNVRAKGLLVDIYAKQQQFDKSIEILEEWVKINPNDQGAKRRLEEYKQSLKKDSLNNLN